MYSAPSTLRVKGSEGTYSKETGYGLFSALKYYKNDVIVSFNGDFVENVIFMDRTRAGNGGYVTRLSENC